MDKKCSLILFTYFLFWGHTQLCARLTPGGAQGVQSVLCLFWGFTFIDTSTPLHPLCSLHSSHLAFKGHSHAQLLSFSPSEPHKQPWGPLTPGVQSGQVPHLGKFCQREWPSLVRREPLLSASPESPSTPVGLSFPIYHTGQLNWWDCQTAEESGGSCELQEPLEICQAPPNCSRPALTFSHRGPSIHWHP